MISNCLKALQIKENKRIAEQNREMQMSVQNNVHKYYRSSRRNV